MGFVDGVVRALVTAGGQVEVGQLVSVRALVAAKMGEVEGGEEEAGKAAHVYFVGDKHRSGADRVVIRDLLVWELFVLVGLFSLTTTAMSVIT